MDNSPQEAKEQGSKLLSLLREATDKNRIHQETVSSVSLARKGLFKLLRLAPNRKDGYNPADAKAAHRFLSVIVSQTHYADKLQRAEQFVEYAFNQRPTVEVSDENGPIATGTLEYVDTEAAVLYPPTIHIAHIT